jgi:DNA transposition AAA+ family ATPase
VFSVLTHPSSLTPAFLHTQGVPKGVFRVAPLEWELLVIDEADRLKPLGLEVLHDFSDRSQMGLMFIGMPGIEKRLARYPQFYSRVGFVHHFCALSPEELREILEQQLCLGNGQGEALPAVDALDEEVLAAIIRLTGGNFRLMHRLLMQMDRIMRIHHLAKVTRAVVEAARSNLVFGRGG